MPRTIQLIATFPIFEPNPSKKGPSKPYSFYNLPGMFLQGHNALTADPEGYGEAGEFRVVSARTGNNVLHLTFELGPPAGENDV